MVKFGKEFKKYQVNQWRESYINYKLLKQQIKTIKNNIENSKSNELRTDNSAIGDIGHPSLKPMDLAADDSFIIEVAPLTSLYNLRYGNELKRFVDLLETEFRKCYVHFSTQEKELYKCVNGHSYSVDIYKDYNILNIFAEIKELALTIKLAKQLNCFINDNVLALKKILKKFDKKFQRYFGIITPKYILTHLTSQNSDLEYMLQFKVIDEATTICENNLNLLLNQYKNLRGNNDNINIDDNNNINLNNIDNNLNILTNRINDYLDRIDELTYFKIQYREWFYYAKQNDRLVKNNPKIFENDIFNPVLSSTYHKDSLLEKCISSKNAFKEVERSQSPLSHSNKTNLILIYIQGGFYGTMLTSIFSNISNYFKKYINSEEPTIFIIPLICTYLAYLLPYTLFIYIEKIDKKNFFMNLSYIISYILIAISSILLFFVNRESSNSNRNMILIIISRILVGFANNQMMNKKYITLYLPKFRLPFVSKIYLISELIGLIIGPIITLLLCLINEYNFPIFEYNHFNCIGWYGLFVSLFLLLIHCFFFIKPLSSDFVMVKDESNISGSKYYQKSESEISRKQYLKEQNMMYKKTYNSIKKKHGGKKTNIGDDEDLIINVKANDKKDNDNNEDIIKTNNNLEEKLITEGDDNKNNKSIDLEKDDNNLDIIGERNIALGEKQQKMINDIEKALEKKNEECNFNDMNQIPKLINSIIDKEKNSFGYINKNLLLLFILFFISSMIKSNIIFNYIYFIQEKIKLEEKKTYFFCLLIVLLGIFQLSKILFIYPFYQVNYKYRFFMLISLTGLALISALLLVFELIYENEFIFDFIYVFIYISIVLGCNIIDISCSCYLSFILTPEWKIFGKNVGYWSNYMITEGKIVGGIFCIFLCDKDYVNNWILFGVSTTFFISFLILILFTRTIKIKGITRVLRKTACEINLDN